MSIKLFNPRSAEAPLSELIKENIVLGKQIISVYQQARFYRERKVGRAVSSIIRDCNELLGCGGNSKNGCLYRENDIAPVWRASDREKVVCDHAVPVTELVRAYLEEQAQLELLIFSPVVRISAEKNDQLTQRGLAKKGFSAIKPLLRYSQIDIDLVTHHGDLVNPATWTIDDHWNLVQSTEELQHVLHELDITF
jgi:hypothetical protein